MLFKLSLRNIRRSVRDYAVYFFTLIIGVSVFYVFNAVGSQAAMMRMEESMNEVVRVLSAAIEALSVFVAVVLGLLIYVYFRMFSRNFQARYAENAKYLALKDRVTGTFARSKRRAEDLKTNHIYKCPSCGQKIRVPRGRGRIIITCRKCGKEFEKKS